ncbi:MAG TPA: bifunctional UDP-sugar hydrolase/5'-nucleotidase [Thermoanaerobaculia bacterium]|nr:bifunctional UDP-sugar hydrolase/5'-nucleotidase [Thermoanaerobaculia bacterium]
MLGVFVAAFAAAASLSAAARTLTILHTSDLHGHVSPRDNPEQREFPEGVARVATAVKAVRSQGSPTLLLDSGDTIEGAPVEAMVFSGQIPDRGDPIVRAMNMTGYDAMAVGNHEFNFGRERLEKSRREAKFPWLSANTVLESGKPAFEPYVVRQVGGVKVGILGLTTKNIPYWEPPSHVAGLKFLDTVETAKRYVPILREKEKCDLVLVITHQGFERDLQTGKDTGSSEENQAYAIATEVPGIDLLLTGHTHTAIEPRHLGLTWVSQPGRFGNTVTRYDLTLEKAGRGWKVSSIEGKNLSMKDVAPDPEILAAVAPEREAASKILMTAVATLSRPVSARAARTEDTALLDWLHAVQREQGKADLSFTSLLPGFLPEWPAGPLTIGQIWAFYPYENTLVTVRATGRQVREALEVAGRCVSGIAMQDGKPVWERNPAVLGYNCDNLDGAEYALDPTRPEKSRVLFLRRDGRPVRDEDVFTVAINSYRAAGSAGYSVWRDCPRVSDTGKALRDLLIEDARRRGTLALESNRNWFLVPGLPEGRFQPGS